MKPRSTKTSLYPVFALIGAGILLGLSLTPATPIKKAYAEPPPWAPAHGYRHKKGKKHKAKYERSHDYESDMPVMAPAPVLTVRCNRDVVGGIVGGIVGGLFGSKIGDGNKVATAAGALAGVLVGSHVGQHMDDADRRCTGQVLENAEDNQAVAWRNPESSTEYTITPLKTYHNRSGTYCREYQSQIVINGHVEDNQGTACRTEDGRWEIVSS